MGTRFDFAAFVPLQVQEILTATPAKKTILDRMRAILIGGAPVDDNLLRQIVEKRPPDFSRFPKFP